MAIRTPLASEGVTVRNRVACRLIAAAIGVLVARPAAACGACTMAAMWLVFPPLLACAVIGPVWYVALAGVFLPVARAHRPVLGLGWALLVAGPAVLAAATAPGRCCRRPLFSGQGWSCVEHGVTTCIDTLHGRSRQPSGSRRRPFSRLLRGPCTRCRSVPVGSLPTSCSCGRVQACRESC